MIVGIGTDICDIRRIEATISRFGDRFVERVFTPGEREYCNARSGQASYYAKRFAAKEAVAKALAGERTGALSWQDVEVKNDPSGRPRIYLGGEAAKRIEHLDNVKIHLTLSDDYPYAVAFVIIEHIGTNKGR